MNMMSDLIAFAQEKKLRPEQAMDALVAQYESQGEANIQQPNSQVHYQPNGVHVGNHTPNMQNLQMPHAQAVNQFSSPAMPNLNLPMQNGSPHISNAPAPGANVNIHTSHSPSPHQGNMAAPAMMPQHSQQGTSSSAASANTSPNVNNKRRRSTVKLEGDEGGAEGGPAANRVKPSPRMNKKGKPAGS